MRGVSDSKEIPLLDGMPLPWDNEELIFAVREPYESAVTGTDIIFGKINNKQPLEIASFMPERGVIFSDGVESDFLSFNAGMVAKISVAEKKGHLVSI